MSEPIFVPSSRQAEFLEPASSGTYQDIHRTTYTWWRNLPTTATAGTIDDAVFAHLFHNGKLGPAGFRYVPPEKRLEPGL